MKILLSLLAVLCASCATQRQLAPSHYTAPQKAADVSASAATVRSDAIKGFVVSARLENQVSSLQTKATTLQDSLAKSFVEASKLRDQKTATEAELDQLYASMTLAQEQVGAIVVDAAAAKQTADEQSRLRAAAEGNLEKLTASAAAKDAEAAALQSQHADMEKTIADNQAINAKLAARVEKSEKAAAVGTYLKWCIGIVGATLIAAIIVIAYLKFLKPI